MLWKIARSGMLAGWISLILSLPILVMADFRSFYLTFVWPGWGAILLQKAKKLRILASKLQEFMVEWHHYHFLSNSLSS